MRCVMLALEYEGRQHAESVQQFNRDITGYAGFRRHGIEYLQITNEMRGRPVVMVLRVHCMCELGYLGPAPSFGSRRDALDRPVPNRPPPKKRWPSHVSESGYVAEPPLIDGTGG
jgi:hypothetical protein